jgi:alkylation response protein AidB-like acyl-CoA dehydrogenase
MTSIPLIKAQVEALWVALKPDRREDLHAFIERAKTTNLPFLPCANDDPKTIHDNCFTALYALGTHSIPLGVALAMHLYMLCALATLPLTEEEPYTRRQHFLRHVAAQKLIIANSGSDSLHRSDNADKSATRAIRRPSGLIVTGHKTFVSLATVADLLMFTAELDQHGVVSLFTALKDNPLIHLGDSPFGEAMDPSGTRSVDFQDLRLPEDSIVTSGHVDHLTAHCFQRAWFQALIPAVYLGAADAALAAARDFARNTSGDDGRPLAELDGFAVAFGQQLLHLRAARAVSQSVRDHLAVCAGPRCESTDIRRFSEQAAAFKYVSMQRAQQAVDWTRRCIGTRAMHPGHLLNRLTSQMPYGSLHPETEGLVERRVGLAYLNSTDDASESNYETNTLFMKADSGNDPDR